MIKIIGNTPTGLKQKLKNINYDIIISMKTITKIFLFFALFLIFPSVNAIEEVVLDIDGEMSANEGFFEGIDDDEWPFDIGGKTLQQKVDEIRAREIKNTSKAHYLLEEILTKKL